MQTSSRLTRRGTIKLGAAAAALPLVHIRTAGAAGKLTVGFWDHWVPPANDAMRRQVEAWAAANKVDVTIDFITSNGNKIGLTQAAESQARTGHDFLPFYNWDVNTYADKLEPVDDLVKAMNDKYGKYSPIHEYLAKLGGHWMALPSSTGTLNLSCCARISLLKRHAGIDIQAMYPAHPSTPSAAADWTYDTFLKAAEACAKAGYAFGLGLGQTGDSVNNTGIIYSAFGAELVNAKGEITVDSAPVHAVLDYARKLSPFLPPDTVSYDDASNNRALISGKSALIFNPPSAWSVAKRDAPKVAEDCWTFPGPAGPKGRFTPYNYCFFGIWGFSPNKTAAKELARHLQERKQVEDRDTAANGYDLPPLLSMSDFQIWSEVEPPKGTVYNYPMRPWHDSHENITAWPAPPDVAAQMYARAVHPTMLAKVYSGQSNEEVVAWAQNELEGFMRQ
ncbi:MAG TPA: extracellular solute-binding protein [Acetobacteraceae bacterium]|jgi:ABC-type glycerol-3-phosphate transport system substrate-binding protein